MKVLMLILVVATVFSVIFFQPETDINDWQPIHKMRFSKSDVVGEMCSKCHSVGNNNIIVLVRYFPFKIVEKDERLS